MRDVGTYIYGLADTLSQALDSAAKDVAELLIRSWTGDYADEFSEGWTDVHDGGRQIFEALATMAENYEEVVTEINNGGAVQFSETERAELINHAVTLASGERRDAIRSADSWAAHIKKIDNDRSSPWSDRSVWNEYDFCAALTIRDYLDTAIDVLSPPLADKVTRYASATDNRYRSITVEDSGKRMSAVAKVDPSTRKWWWFRVPDSGPILEDLARWDRFENSQ